MDACGSSHYCAPELERLGKTVKLMAPQFVKPYVKSNKHDAADAVAIFEAVTRTSMRLVSIKNIVQNAVLCRRSLSSVVFLIFQMCGKVFQDMD